MKLKLDVLVWKRLFAFNNQIATRVSKKKVN